jgi:chaperone modulatory protein CbpM
MADKTLPMISPEIIHPGAMYTLDELYQSCNVEVDWVVQLVEQGVIEPVGQARSDW